MFHSRFLSRSFIACLEGIFCARGITLQNGLAGLSAMQGAFMHIIHERWQFMNYSFSSLHHTGWSSVNIPPTGGIQLSQMFAEHTVKCKHQK